MTSWLEAPYDQMVWFAAILYLGASSAALIAYAIDKSAAVHNRRRISEKSLHIVALLGGWPGALAAQKLLRHKTVKQPFCIIFYATVVLNMGMLLWAFSPDGIATLTALK